MLNGIVDAAGLHRLGGGKKQGAVGSSCGNRGPFDLVSYPLEAFFKKDLFLFTDHTAVL
jgi:hypothetical protein